MRSALVLTPVTMLSLAVTAGAQTKLRELSTDRPDRTESPYTVDRGHRQLEMDVVNVVDGVRDGIGPRSFGLGAINAKLGLRRNIDFQIVTQLVTISSEKVPGTSTPHIVSGPADLTARVKVNVWGDDGGRTAFAVMPYLTSPINDNAESQSVTGGVILPFAIDLGRGWGAGMMSELDVVRHDSGRGLQVNAIHSATISHGIAGTVGGYAELVAETITTDKTRLVPTGDVGLTIGAGDNLQFDVGANIGLNRNADRVAAFIGIARRS